MNTQRFKDRRAIRSIPQIQADMIGRPSIVPIDGVNGAAALPKIQTDPFFSLKVDTTGLVAATEVVLFDASMGYQLNKSIVMPLALLITGLTSNYQAMLNDLAHVSAYVDLLKMTVSDENVALSQYARPLKVYESSKGSDPRLIKTLHPEMGVHEGQYQKGINSFTADLVITNRTAISYVQEPGIVVTWGLYQKAELGRKQ